jgi:polar amino acid transport system substrate-binding protein
VFEKGYTWVASTFRESVVIKRGFFGLLCGAAIAWVVTANSQPAPQADPSVAEIVGAGKIRIGVFPSTQYVKDGKSGDAKGLSLDITRLLAARLGIREVVPVEYANPVGVLACLKAGECDLGFTAYDRPRLNDVDFTPPYIRRDFTYLVPPGSSIRSPGDADRQGIRIAAVRGHASTASLVRILKQATLVYAEDFEPAMDMIRAGKVDAFGSVRDMLLGSASNFPGAQVLQEGYDTSLVAVSVQKGRVGWLSYVSEFLDETKRSGWMRQAIDRAGLQGFEVVD